MNFSLITNRDEIECLVPEYKNRGENYPFLFLSNNKIVADGEIEFDSGEVGSVEIKYLNVFEKGTGYGRQFVNHIKSLPNVKGIWGESIPQAVPFWKKVGATFDPDEYNEYLKTEEFEGDYLLVFSIPVEHN